MDYNTQRKQLILPEYGRYVQDMVDYAKTLEDKVQRQICAETIIKLMNNIHGKGSKSEDLQHKLWNHLAAMAGYELDIDYPVEIKHMDASQDTKEYLKYPQKQISRRHYGALIEESARILHAMDDGEAKTELSRLVANQMKRALAAWNKNALDDEKIIDDMAEYTEGAIDIHNLNVHLISDNVALNCAPTQQTKKKKKK